MPKLKCSGEGTSLTNFQNVKNDPMGPNNLEFLGRFPNMTDGFSKFQVIKIWQCYIEAIFNPKSSQKVLKIARFRNIWCIAYCDWFLHIHGLLLMTIVHKIHLKVILSWINWKMMHKRYPNNKYLDCAMKLQRFYFCFEVIGYFFFIW